MKRAIAFGCVVLALTLVGCNNKPSLVGKWNGQIDQQGQSVTATVEFKGDGKMVSDIEVQGMKMQLLGSYTVKEDSYTATIDDIKIIEMPKELEQLRPMMEQSIAKEKGKSNTTKFTFKDKDTVEMSSEQGGTSTWTRIK